MNNCLNDVLEVIDKHIEKHDKSLNNAKWNYMLLDCLIDEDVSLKKELKDKMNDHASAIAGLVMVRNELKGEVEY